ncbi:MASE4 domain-containing protein [Raoultella sp. WB_B2P2-3]|uniref:MASE4 domain-containing protein n=1 Tax=Raoultella scottii TaxID=3040937 RepID=A0ABU8Z394_9ENTR
MFLLILHLTMSGFMMMKYWCVRERLHLTAIACAFGGSALLVPGRLSDQSDWLLCNQGPYLTLAPR